MSIQLKDLKKNYGDFTAVNNINLEFQDKKLSVLIGPSGCGKTTILKMINRLIERTSGDIVINGKSIEDINTIDLRRSMGYVIQEIGLFPHMTVFDNIAVVPKLLKWEENKIKNRVYELLDLVNLDPSINAKKFPAQLSGGQRQRVGVARGLAADPDILLMDEPFGAIDPINRETLQNGFLEIQEKIQKTIVFVTHDIREAIKLGDRIVILNKGNVEQEGSTLEVVKKPKNQFVREILGDDSEFKTLEFMKVLDTISEIPETFEIGNFDFSSIKNKNLKIIIFTKDNKFFGFIENRAIENISNNKDLKNHLKTYRLQKHLTLFDALNIMLRVGVSSLPVINNKSEVIGQVDFSSIFKKISPTGGE
ncbi:MAG: ATP-binding cassette domain-containing protein [Thermotogota bacterium]